MQIQALISLIIGAGLILTQYEGGALAAELEKKEEKIPTYFDPQVANNIRLRPVLRPPTLREGRIRTAALPSDIDRRLPEARSKSELAGPETQTPAETPALREGPARAFVLTAVEIDGATAFPPERFAPLYDGLLARSISITEITALVDNITALYRDEGYFLSRAVAPAQDPAKGILRIEIAEGYISDIAFEGDATPAIKARLDKLTRQRPIRLTSLERALLNIGDLPGVTVASSRIEPHMDDLAAHRLVVALKGDRLEARLYADNRGKERAGPVQTYARVAANSVFTTGDQLSGGVFFIPTDPSELTLGELSYRLPLTRSGAYATMSALISRFDAGASLATPGVESTTKSLDLTLSHPIIRRRKTSLWGNIGFVGRDIEEMQLGLPTFDDKLRVLYASMNFRKEYWNGVTSVSGRASRGLSMLGASSSGGSLSRPDADAEFTKFETQISRYQNIGRVFGVYASFSGQTSLDPLLASEEFALGGAQFGRAYDYSELTGDDGLAVLLELRYGRSLNTDIIDFFQLYAFSDYGVVWNDNALPGFERLDLSSAGGGVRLTLPSSIYATFEVAKPLDRVPTTQDDRDWRGFFSVSKNF